MQNLSYITHTDNLVLIDTQWNVNKILLAQSENESMVLIDTQWNVNKQKSAGAGSIPVCFNRYIVECKYAKKYVRTGEIDVLIDTQWNVNVVNGA